ncbi:MAG: PDDEXK nuclease domain-containing protein [Elusimicrobia bacterium]|nr:PDDEXK nuclease domain-containing protein [Elusimicrobiota bacterium]
MNKLTVSSAFYNDIRKILETARNNAYKAVNFAMVEAYWGVGKRIVEEEQEGSKRAEYGEYLLKNLSERLTKELGKGFSEANIRNFRQFYLSFSENGQIRYALRSELSWAHYRLIMRVENHQARVYYMNEAAECGWSSRALERQIVSHYYERLLTSKNKRTLMAESNKAAQIQPAQPSDFIKDPYVLDFLGLDENRRHQEKDIEQAILNQLQKFLLELGKGFTFVSRQHRISTESKEFYIDLVFYNYILKCFVLVDLKTGKLTHQDIGQMDMYVRLFEDKMKQKGDNPTIGIILCSEKDETVVKYSVMNKNKKLFASKYKLYIPSEKELIAEVEREKQILRLDMKKNSK